MRANTSDIVFISNEADYHNYNELTPRTKYQRSRVSFKCTKCGKCSSKAFWRLKIPFLCAECQFEKTNIEKYGTKYPMQTDGIKEKLKECLLEKYGVDNAAKSVVVKTKMENTNLRRYGVKNAAQSKEIHTKMENTCLERYGVTSPLKSKDIYEKFRSTMNEKYGVNTPMQNKDIQEKTRKTNIEKYNHCCPLLNDKIKEKAKTTMIEKYGVEHALQNHEIFCKSKQKYKYDGLCFDSKPEIEFYKVLKENFIDFEYQPNIFFEYEYNEKIHKYFPDFKVGNVFYELKGSYFFENDKMINPYDRSQDDLYEAKHQCMISNGIIIIKV